MPASIARWAVLASLLGGCACCCGNWVIGPSPDIVAADIVGTWVSDEGSRIVLNADLTFRTELLTACAREDAVEVELDGGEGTWSLGEPETLDPYQDLRLDYQGGFDDWSWRAQDDEIVYIYGDADNGEMCFFERRT